MWFYQDSFAGGTTAAIYDAGKGPDATRFICLHGGREALFVYTLPE